MIRVSDVTKRYPARTAVDAISFEVAAGEIVGFLGPNGAGKSTTMRMLAGYFPPDAGRIEVAGYDMAVDSVEIRRRIGYLPESCPLYPEMRVDEYLRFRAELKGVRPRLRRAKIAEVKERCGLTEVGRRIIGQLSKGNRQRVGLADALVHDPELLILDEPTVGLDPHQIRQVRELIHALSERHTVLLSTHILSEVEAICERVLIIDEGRLVASDSVENLRRELHPGTLVRLAVRVEEKAALAEIGSMAGAEVVLAESLEDGWLALEVEASVPDACLALHRLVVSAGWDLRELSEREHSLEDTFVRITRRGGGAT